MGEDTQEMRTRREEMDDGANMDRNGEERAEG
jgi:hypothetical protein